MKFGLITYILHHRHNGKLYSYEPYIREMNIWLKHTSHFLLLAPKKQKFPDPIEIAYLKNPDELFEIPQIDALNRIGMIKSIIALPVILIKLFMIMKRADHIHLRCPGNIGLLGCLVQVFFPSKHKTAKYAGNWDPNSKQPLSYKLQKWLLSNTFLTRNIKVLVYGEWPLQSRNILPFFTASFHETEKEVIRKNFNPPYKFLFVGSLVSGKQPLFAAKIVEALIKRNMAAELHIYGTGPLINDLEKEAKNKEYIHLHGNQPLDILKQAYKDAHFLVLVSKSEGWPKAIAEAMFFGCIPIASAVSCVPWMLGGGSRGVILSGKGENVEYNKFELRNTVERIIGLIQNSEEIGNMSLEAQEWSQEYTLEKFEEGIKKLLLTEVN